MSSKRMTANPVKAPRYRPGKVVEEASSSESSDDEETKEVAKAPAAVARAPPKATTAAGIRSDLSKVDLNARRKEAAAKEAARVREEEELRRKEEEGFVTEEEEEEEEEGSEEGSDRGSSEEDESSEEEAPRRVMMRPTFIKKDKRKNGAATEVIKTDEEYIAEEEERRKAAADEIVEEQIRKDLLAKEAGKKNWDDDEGDEDEVDDTDDLDPEAEYAAWKLRELRRIKREREAIEEREKEREEVERRKALTEDERKREDDEFIAKQKEEKGEKAQAGFMQKYYHKGAFYQDDAKAEGLDRRDLMGSKFADEINRELLPQALQMRDMTKIGKKGATKYKDLRAEDTGSWGKFDDRARGRGGGGPPMTDERFMSDRDREHLGASGANNTPVGERKNVSGAPTAPRGGQRDGGWSNRDRKSRSRSPYNDDRGRKRATSRDGDRSDGEKRRRVDSR